MENGIQPVMNVGSGYNDGFGFGRPYFKRNKKSHIGTLWNKKVAENNRHFYL